MLHLITGVPGACKTAFCVTKLDDTEKANKVNLVKNLEIYKHNQPLMAQYAHDFTYREYEVGSGHELKRKIEVLPDDFFDFLGQEFDDLRPDYYYQRMVYYNEIIQRITERDGDKGFKTLLPVRTIYTNINALKIDYVRALTYDWRECPDGSIIVIDEVQLVEPYSDLKTKDNPIIQDLTIHRHRGFDFYFITQYPSLLHPTVKVLVGEHYHLTRPYGMKTVVYQHGSAKDNPNAQINRQNVESKFFFTPQDRIFKLYKSTTINTHKKRVPKGIFFFLAWIVLAIGFFIWNLSGDDLEKSTVFGDKDVKDKVADVNQPTGAVNPFSADTSSEQKTMTPDQVQELLRLQKLEFELQLHTQRANMLMEYKALKMQMLEQDKRFDDFYRELELVRSMLPKDYEIIKRNPDLQVRGVIKMGNKCQAYNTHGVLMTLNHEQCTYYTDQPGRVYKSGQTADISPSEPRYLSTLSDNSQRTQLPLMPDSLPSGQMPTTQDVATPSDH